MEWKTLNSKNNKIELSLSALMFFSPLINNNIKDRQDITNDDKIFIKWFVRLWYLNIVLLLNTITLWVIYYNTTLPIFNTLCNISLIILIVFLWIWSLFAILEKPIVKSNYTDNEATVNKSNIMLNFVPLYNIYLWYQNHDFDNQHTELKESLILWWLFSIIALLPINKYIIISCLIIILLFLIARIVWLDFGEKYNNFVDNLFKKNPEEIWWYAAWLLKTPFVQWELKDIINEQKWKYSLIYKMDYKHILLEYIILAILILCGLYIWMKSKNGMILLWIILVIWRYGLMLIKWKHVPHIPVLREFTNLFFRKKIQSWDTH